jgi:hypothetical protein
MPANATQRTCFPGAAYFRGLILLLVVLCAAKSHAADPVEESVNIDPKTWLGEVIEYRVSFGIVPAGKAKLSVIDTATINGLPVLHAISTARTAKAFDLVFKVRDSVETWFNSDSVYVLRARKKLSEGRWKEENYVEFNLENGTARWWKNGKEKQMMPVEPRVQDVLSAGYKARTLPLAVGDTFSIKTHDVDKTYDLLVFVLGRESVETPAGTFDCFKVEPVLRSGGLFKKEKGARVFIWVTADKRRIPVQMSSKVSFGSVSAVMESYTAPRGIIPQPNTTE